MKKLFLFLSISFSLQAQSDSLKVTFSEEKVEKFEKTTLIDEYEKAFGGNRVVKSGLRFSLSNPEIFRFGQLGIEYEQKVFHFFSISTGIISDFRVMGSPVLLSTLEGKWFFNMKNRTLKNKQKLNLTGNFISISFQKNGRSLYSIQPNYFDNDLTNYPVHYLASSQFQEVSNLKLTLGKQFGNALKFGINIGIRNGQYLKNSNFYSESLNFPEQKINFFISSISKIATGILLPTSSKKNANKCEFLKCNFEVKSLLKVNLNQSFSIDPNIQFVKTDIAFERKLGKSPFSLNSNLEVSLSNFRQYFPIDAKDTTYFDGNSIIRKTMTIYSKSKKNDFYYRIKFSEQLRYYLGMKNRVLTGKSANNLNGLYCGIEGDYIFDSYLNNGIYFYPYKHVIESSYGIIIGYQTQTNRNSFLDFNLYFGDKSIQSNPKNDFFINRNAYMHNNIAELRIKLGLAK